MKTLFHAALCAILLVLPTTSLPIQAATYNLIAKLKPGDPKDGQLFGWSVAVSRDQALVGSVNDIVNGQSVGSAYRFDAKTGTQFQKILPSGTGVRPNFGSAVAQNGQSILVSAPSDGPMNRRIGSASLYDARTGQHVMTFGPPNPQGSEQFGRNTIALSGNRALIGAAWAPNEFSYLFDTKTGDVVHAFAPNNGNALFGASNALNRAHALIGAPFEKVGTVDHAGAAYLFNTGDGALSRKFALPSPAQYDGFGVAVALDGNHALIGASGRNQSGAAYLFDTLTGNLMQVFTVPGLTGQAVFGEAVAILGDHALIGARWADGRAGAAYLFDINSGDLLQTFLPNGTGTQEFGHSLALSKRYAIVGARFDNDAGQSTGAAYLYGIAPVPLPAGLPLVVSALAALLFVRRGGLSL